MPRSRGSRKGTSKRSTQQPPSIKILLDAFSVDDIRAWAAFQDKILRFHWDYYSNLAFQRSKVVDQIKSTLLEAAEGPFVFSTWQRVVRHKYSLEPLSVEGSLVDPGGRFNIGEINPTQFPPFPALYIASDKKTALQEMLCQKIKTGQEQQALEFALASPTSIASVSLSGSIDSYINLRNPEKLQSFVDYIKGFTIPNHLIKTSKEIGSPSPQLIQNVTKLLDSLLDTNWRSWPMQLDVPHTCQIFGQIVAETGIEGILYPSKFNERDCLAIFPQNFEEDGSYVQLDDEAPAETRVDRLDAQSWAKIQRMKV